MTKYDLAIIGGGAAGMMAAGHAAELGAKVVLLEKNKQLGVKLLITGKGRCNITNAEPEIKNLISFFGKKGKFLYTAFHTFSNADTIQFFEKQGLKTKEERGKRIFPLSDNAKDVVNSLKRYIDVKNIDIHLNTTVKSINFSEEKIKNILLENGQEIQAHQFLIATGGKSYPQTGSTGEAFSWIQKLGHRIIPVRPALTPILIKEKLVHDLAGLSLKNVEISLWNEKKIISFFGEALFTHNGLSGPIILNLSNRVNLKEKQILKIDFKPALDHTKLDLRLRKDFEKYSSKQFKNALGDLLPKKLIPLFIKLSEIPEEKKVAEISKIERKKLLNLFKEFKLTITGIGGFEKAIISSGGVDLKEINPKTMQSKKIKNLFFAGEIIDIDGPTGGYNLQVAWSTAYLAAENTCGSVESIKG